MPYNVDEKNDGGDSPENEKFMENCVKKVMKDGKSKGSAIAICKTVLHKSKNDKEKAEFIINELLASSFVKRLEK